MSSTTAAASTTRGAGPLTTVFSTPEFCASSAWNYYDIPPLSSSICMPNGFTEYWNYKNGFYSPGICPESYTQGCAFPTSFAVVSNGTPFIGGPLESGETAIICCPAGYTCMSSLSDSYAYSKCVATTSSTYVLAEPTVTHVTTTPLVFAIQVRWRSSDLSMLETNPTRSGETITSTSAATSTGQTSNDSTTTATSKGSDTTSSTGESSSSSDEISLSTGAAIGIGVGVGVGVIAVCMTAYLIWRRKSRSKQNAASSGGPDGKGFTELQDTEIARRNNTTAAELASPEGTWNDSSTLGDFTMVSPLTARPGTATAAAATEMEVPDTTHELPGHVTDFAEMPASNEFVAELAGDTPGDPRKRWN